MLKRKNKAGIGLLELMLALAVIALLLIMATRYFTLVDRSRKITSTIDTVELMQAAAQRWILTNDDFSGITSMQDLVDHNLLPDSFDKSNKPLDEWGGAISITGNKSYLLLTLSAVPDSMCARLQSKITNNITCAPPGIHGGGVKCGGSGGGASISFYPCISSKGGGVVPQRS